MNGEAWKDCQWQKPQMHDQNGKRVQTDQEYYRRLFYEQRSDIRDQRIYLINPCPNLLQM